MDTEYQTFSIPNVIWGLRLEVDLNCAQLGYYASNSGNLLQTFQVTVISYRRFGTTYVPIF